MPVEVSQFLTIRAKLPFAAQVERCSNNSNVILLNCDGKTHHFDLIQSRQLRDALTAVLDDSRFE